MREFRKSSYLAGTIIYFFMMASVLGTGFAGCSGSGSSADSSSTVQFGNAQETASAADGSFTIIGDTSGRTINATVMNSSENPVSGLEVEFVETIDGTSGMIIIDDPTGVYQTTIITLDEYGTSSEVSAMTVGGVPLDFTYTYKIEPFTIITIAVVILTVYSAISLAEGIYELAGDPPSLSHYKGKRAICVSPDQVLTVAGIGLDAVALFTAGTPSAAAAAASTTKAAFKVVASELVQELGENALQEAGESLFDEVLESRGYDADQEYCMLLWESLATASAVGAGGAAGAAYIQSQKFDSALDLLPTVCVNGECVDEEETLPDPNDFDSDGDTYTPNEDDCNDYNKYINPAAVEICGDGIDNNCSGSDLSCADPSAFSIEIDSPGYTQDMCAGTWSNGVCYGDERALFIGATLSGSNLPTSATVTVNGRSSTTEVQNGQMMSGNMALLKCDSDGWANLVSASAINSSNVGAAHTIEYGCNATASELLVMLFWDVCDNETDLDLYVMEPDGTVLFDNSGVSPSGGQVIDDYGPCYGPVYYVIGAGAPVGRYNFRVHYKEGNTQPNYTIHFIKRENFDHMKTKTGILMESDPTSTSFTDFNDSWAPYRWMVYKETDGPVGWSTPFNTIHMTDGYR